MPTIVLTTEIPSSADARRHPERHPEVAGLAGPFRRWWHEHRFEPVPGGTRMTDTVEYASPVGPLGRLVERLILTRYLTRLLRTRNHWLVEALAPRA